MVQRAALAPLLSAVVKRTESANITQNIQKLKKESVTILLQKQIRSIFW